MRSQVDSLEFVDDRHGVTRAGIDDFVLRRRDGVPSYNLAVVVDDAEMGIDQVVRGDDLLLSTPRHLHLADLLGLPRPTHAHVPLAVNRAGERLAKGDGAVTIAELGPRGVSPADVRAMMARSLGLRARWVLPVPLLTPRLSSLWIHLVTPLSHHIARPLAEGLRNRVVCRN